MYKQSNSCEFYQLVIFTNLVISQGNLIAILQFKIGSSIALDIRSITPSNVFWEISVLGQASVLYDREALTMPEKERNDFCKTETF